MGIADIARSIDRGVNRRGIVRKRHEGWLPKILPYMGYGSTHEVRVLARAVMANPEEPERSVRIAKEAIRGFRQFFTTQVGYLPITVTIGNRHIETRTDESGYIDVLVEDHGLEPGEHPVTITPIQGIPATAHVLIVSPNATTGIISDIDDTVIVTALPRPLLAAWNSFVLHTNSRQAVPGMTQFYASLLADYPNAPVFYLSTGAWNTASTLENFLSRHGFPGGPLLMTDWGPTPTGLFRSGQAHKQKQLRNLLLMFPNIRWILVGDDGQHDPIIYDELAREHPTRVLGIALRELDPVEQVLAHGTPLRTEAKPACREIPVVHGRNGFVLRDRWARIISRSAALPPKPESV